MADGHDAGVAVACPCCGYPTLSWRGLYDICELCNWEDDGQDDEQADKVYGGPNEMYSLSEARANFERFLIMYDPARYPEGIGHHANTPAEADAKRAIMAAFDAMMARPRPMKAVIQAHWQTVIDNEAILRSELERRVAEYSAARAKDAQSGT